MKSFNQFIQEKWVADIKGLSTELPTGVYENPSSSDLVDLTKAKAKDIRFLAIPKTNKVYVWDANKVLHQMMIYRLKQSNVIPQDVDYDNPKTIFCGIAKLQNGDLDYVDVETDINFYSAIRYSSKKIAITKGVLPKGFNQPETFEQELKDLVIEYKFADHYIRNLTKLFPPSTILYNLR